MNRTSSTQHAPARQAVDAGEGRTFAAPWDASIDDDVVADLVQSRPDLEAVDLRFCPRLTAAGVAALTKLPKLTSLRLSGVRLGRHSMADLAACRGLTRLEVLDCPAATAEQALALKRQLPALKHIDGGCGAE